MLLRFKDKWKGVCSQRGREFWTIGPWYPFPFSFLFYLGSAMSCSYIRKWVQAGKWDKGHLSDIVQATNCHTDKSVCGWPPSSGVSLQFPGYETLVAMVTVASGIPDSGYGCVTLKSQSSDNSMTFTLRSLSITSLSPKQIPLWNLFMPERVALSSDWYKVKQIIVHPWVGIVYSQKKKKKKKI